MINYLCSKSLFNLKKILESKFKKAKDTPNVRIRISNRVGGVSCNAKLMTIKRAIRYVTNEKNLLNLLDVLIAILVLSFVVSLALSISYFFQAKNSPAIATTLVIMSIIAILISVVNKIKVYHISKRIQDEGGAK